MIFIGIVFIGIVATDLMAVLLFLFSERIIPDWKLLVPISLLLIVNAVAIFYLDLGRHTKDK